MKLLEKLNRRLLEKAGNGYPGKENVEMCIRDRLSSPRRVWRYRYSGYQRYPSIPECFRFCGVKSIDHLYGRNPWNQRDWAALRNRGLRNFVNHLQ